MSQSNKKTAKPKDPGRQKKTSQRQVEPDDALITIREQKAELDALREKLEQADREANALQVQIDDKQSKFDKAQQQLKTLQAQIGQVEAENDELKLKNGKSERTRKELQSRLADSEQRLKEAEERSSAAVEGAEQKDKDENRELRREIKDLRRKLAEAESRTIGDMPDSLVDENGSAPTSKFLVYIYDRQGKHIGRIIHLPSEDTKAFTGLEMGAIKELIVKHLPRSAKQTPVGNHEMGEKSGSELVPPEEPESTVPRDQDSRAQGKPRVSPAVAKMEIRPATARHEGLYITHDEPIKVVLNLRHENLEIAGAKTLSYSINMYVRKLGGGPSKKVAETAGTIPSTAVGLPIETTINPIPAGSYRLEAAVTFSAQNGEPAPVSSFLEGSLFRVF